MHTVEFLFSVTKLLWIVSAFLVLSTNCFSPTHIIIGCFESDQTGFTYIFKNDDMTHQRCITRCVNNGYRYAGLEHRDECWCGSNGWSRSTELCNKNCDHECEGNDDQICGERNCQTVIDTSYMEPTTAELTITTIPTTVTTNPTSTTFAVTTEPTTTVVTTESTTTVVTTEPTTTVVTTEPTTTVVTTEPTTAVVTTEPTTAVVTTEPTTTVVTTEPTTNPPTTRKFTTKQKTSPTMTTATTTKPTTTPVITTIPTTREMFTSVTTMIATASRVTYRWLPNIPKTCLSSPLNVESSKVQVLWGTRGTVAGYTCRASHAFIGGGISRTIICDDGEWNTVVPLCKAAKYCRRTTGNEWIFSDGLSNSVLDCNGERPPIVNPCLPPPYVAYAVTVIDESARSVEITCNLGRRFPDGRRTDVFYCSGDNTWQLIPRCRLQYCKELPIPDNGRLSTSLAVYDTLAEASCDDGYAFPDRTLNRFLYCNDSAIWSNHIDNCTVVYCTNPPIVAQATQIELQPRSTNGLFEYAARVVIVCRGDRKLEYGQRSAEINCTGAGIWNETLTSCDYNRCDPVPEFRYAVPDGRLALQDTVIRYSCVPGYRLKDPLQSSIICDGTSWSNTSVQCVEIGCPELDVQHGRVNSSTTEVGQSVVVECDIGYKYNNNQSVVTKCLSSGHWTENITCLPVYCGDAATVYSVESNVRLTSHTGSTYLDNCTYRCTDFHWFARNVHELQMTCAADERWHRIDKGVSYDKCIPIRCPAIILRLLTLNSSSPGTYKNVTCPKGYHLQGGHNFFMTLCSEKGNWIPEVPECVKLDPMPIVFTRVEAKSSAAIAWTVFTVFFAVCITMIISDIPTFRSRLPNHKFS